MSWNLIVIKGPDKGLTFTLTPENTLLLGRSRRCDARLSDPHVSRIHCEVELDGEEVAVTALDSKNGTLINDKPIDERKLKAGDLLRIGATVLRLEGGNIHEQSTVVSAPAPVTLPRDRLGELSGRKLSHYAVGSLIARSGSGMVFKALDFRKDLEVAFKVLWPDFAANEDSKRRFVRAMKTMMPHRHANLVTLQGAGKTGPYCWMAMEFIDGESLTRVIERIGTAGMLDWRYAFRVAVHIGRALEYLHGHHIVHRNIKPQHILVQAKDQSARLGGWMLAKALEGPLAEEITQQGQVLGDLRFMSPERLSNSPHLDARSDIYSLGATTYALLTGRVPCEGTTLKETIQKIRSAAPEKPKKFQMSIPDLFDGTVLKMLAKRPDERYASATALLEDLERVGKYQGLTA